MATQSILTTFSGIIASDTQRKDILKKSAVQLFSKKKRKNMA